MYTKYPTIYQRTKCKVVENLAAAPPDIRIAVFSHAFVIKSIYLSDLTRLVVASYEEDAVWVANFIG